MFSHWSQAVTQLLCPCRSSSCHDRGCPSVGWGLALHGHQRLGKSDDAGLGEEHGTVNRAKLPASSSPDIRASLQGPDASPWRLNSYSPQRGHGNFVDAPLWAAFLESCASASGFVPTSPAVEGEEECMLWCCVRSQGPAVHHAASANNSDPGGWAVRASGGTCRILN